MIIDHDSIVAQIANSPQPPRRFAEVIAIDDLRRSGPIFAAGLERNCDAEFDSAAIDQDERRPNASTGPLAQNVSLRVDRLRSHAVCFQPLPAAN